MGTLPLVSCIMPTYNRRHFVPRAIEYFLRQDYEPKELIVVDDGTDSVADLMPDDQRIRYFRFNEKLLLGAKLNLACEYALGDIIARWDDDDWYASHRLSYQVHALLPERIDLCGLSHLLYYNLQTGRAYKYLYPSGPHPWISDICYFKAFWARNRFAEIPRGMDAKFVWNADPRRVTPLTDCTFAVHTIHAHNVSPKQTKGAYWHSFPVEEIHRIVEADWSFYQQTRYKNIGRRFSLKEKMQGDKTMEAYIWPLSKSTKPDKMNTSFGPRINGNKWDFHDGIDLPAPIGTNVYAMHDGIVHRAGPGGIDKFSSRHVIIEVDDQDDEMYLVYVHLESIAEGIIVGEAVSQGQLIGTVGEDDATYSHLHIEFRKGGLDQENSVHPLSYLPYSNTTNFTAPVSDRFNRLDDGLMAARLLFGAKSKLEGDLQRVEVDLMSGATPLETRIVDFNDKDTINEGNGDEFLFKNSIGVEGYQKSDMVKDGRTDLKYGILIHAIPGNCDTLVARVIDVKGHVATSARISIPNQIATDETVDFEDGAMPPDGWDKVESDSGTGTTVAIASNAAHLGKMGMLSTDDSTTESKRQKAGIEYTMPGRRFEWLAKGWFKLKKLNLDRGQTIDLLHFRDSNSANLSIAARLFRDVSSFRAGIVIKNLDGTLRPSASTTEIKKNAWVEWKLRLLRIGTRETTAILLIDNDEKLRMNWDSTIHEPLRLRAGIGHSSAGATATVLADDLQLTESSHQDEFGLI